MCSCGAWQLDVDSRVVVLVVILVAVAGEGLGKRHQGVAAPIEVRLLKRRAGLGDDERGPAVRIASLKKQKRGGNVNYICDSNNDNSTTITNKNNKHPHRVSCNTSSAKPLVYLLHCCSGERARRRKFAQQQREERERKRQQRKDLPLMPEGLEVSCKSYLLLLVPTITTFL